MLKILTIGGGRVGYGHLGRCIPILDAAGEMGVQAGIFIHFIGQGLEEHNNRQIINIDWINKIEALELSKNDIVLIDALNVNDETLDRIGVACKDFFIIDDIGKQQYKKYRTIDWSLRSYIYGSKLRSSYIASPKYVPLRTAFSNFKKKEIKKKPLRIMITMGGSDIKNMTPKIIDFIQSNFPDLKLTVIVGPGFENLNEIIQVCGANADLSIQPTDEELVNAMETSDIAIATGGHTLYELAAAGLSTIQLQVAENQEVSKYWAEYGFSRYAGTYDSDTLWFDLSNSLKSFMPLESRIKSARLGQKLIDGKGSYRLVKKLVEHHVG